MREMFVGMTVVALIFGILASAAIRYAVTGSPSEVITFTLTNR